jgi:hypothetical protein
MYKIFFKIWTFYGISFIQGVNRLKTIHYSVSKTKLVSLVYFVCVDYPLKIFALEYIYMIYLRFKLM